MAQSFLVKGIYPKKMIDPDGAKQWMREAIDTYALLGDIILDQTHSNWSAESAPERTRKETTSGKDYIVSIGRSGMIYDIVSKGRDPKASWIRYGSIPEKTFAATQPGSLKSGRRGESNKRFFVSEEDPLMHPGIRAREFDVQTVDLLMSKNINRVLPDLRLIVH